MWKNTNRRIVVHVGLGIIKQDPISKITNTKRAGVWLKWYNASLASAKL
jgi:hypothetical protein